LVKFSKQKPRPPEITGSGSPTNNQLDYFIRHRLTKMTACI